jgi:nitrogen fixation/metabolism regulation signal transduction histidine kinase
MDELGLLNNAFHTFAEASKKLELHYEKLQERINHLTLELEKKNLQLEKALEETEKAKDYLKCILHSIGEAIVVVDYNRIVTMINRAAEEMFGITYEEAVGKPLSRLNISIKKEGTDALLYANGKRYNVFFTASDIVDSTNPDAIRGQVILLKDITRLKELEMSHERNKRLIAMGEMAAKIVHEIRSPLCSIELYASMLKNDLEGTTHINLANGISNGIRSLNNILTNMLFFARPQKPLFKNVDLKEVIDESLNIIYPMIESRGVVINKNIPNGYFIMGDKELLKQVFLNIVLNALSVTNKDRNIFLDLREEGDFVAIDIKDEGTGIKEEDIERIFDPFFTTKEKGTGLGLTIASKIMLAHNGFIKVKSRWGEGSCFQLYLPFSRNKKNNDKKFGKELFFYEADSRC